MIEFLNDDHRKRFVDMVWMFSNGRMTMPAEWAACLFILTANPDIWRRVSRHVDLEGHLVYWTQIRRLDMGHGWELLLKLAQNLYNGDGKPDIAEMVDVLDVDNFTLMVNAIMVRRAGLNALKVAA